MLCKKLAFGHIKFEPIRISLIFGLQFYKYTLDPMDFQLGQKLEPVSPKHPNFLKIPRTLFILKLPKFIKFTHKLVKALKTHPQKIYEKPKNFVSL
jgi:hypothetical protein